MDINNQVVRFYISEYERIEQEIEKLEGSNGFGRQDLKTLKMALIEALGASNNENAEDFLIKQFLKAKSYEKADFYTALGRIGGDNVAKILINEILQQDQHRDKPYEALGLTGSVEAIRFLVKQYREVKSSSERLEALKALSIANK